MDELIKLISSQIGVTPDKAQIAVQAGHESHQRQGAGPVESA